MKKRKLNTSQVIKEKANYLFVSPHLDDAVFSAGGLLGEIVQKGGRVIVVNVFTKTGNGPDSLSARQYLKQCGGVAKQDLYSKRISEDERALLLMKAKIINLGYVEALWRTKRVGFLRRLLAKFVAEAALVYPTYRWHVLSGKVSEADNEIVREISNKVREIVDEYNPKYIFAPEGVGGHADHLVVKRAIGRIRHKKLYWLDYPYSVRDGGFSKQPDYLFMPDWKKKTAIMKMYKTQYRPVIGDKLTETKEEFYLT